MPHQQAQHAPQTGKHPPSGAIKSPIGGLSTLQMIFCAWSIEYVYLSTQCEFVWTSGACPAPPSAPYPALRATFPPVGARKGLSYHLYPHSGHMPFRSTGRRKSITDTGGGAMGYSFPCPHRGKGGRRPDRGRGVGRSWLRLGRKTTDRRQLRIFFVRKFWFWLRQAGGLPSEAGIQLQILNLGWSG